MDKHVKLFIPGPVEVHPRVYEAMSAPMIGHRSKDFQALYAEIQPRLRTLFGTSQPVYLSTSSAWGIMEGCIRNLVHKKVLNCMCGAFSDKWFDVSTRCGKEAEALQVEWGNPILPEMIDERLSTGDFDTVTLVHNETSTGVLNPVADIARVMQKHPEVCWVTDTVSSFTTLPVPMDELGFDVMLTGSQKALALPPGLALFSVSEKAMARAETMPDRGYYFDFLEFRKNGEKDMTPSTPSISLIYGLGAKLQQIFEEGLEARFARHAETNGLVHDWVRRQGFEFFAPEGYRSKSLTCVKNNRGIDVAALIGWLRENRNCVIDGGYGKIKGETFRISNMGDESAETITLLLQWLDEGLAATAG